MPEWLVYFFAVCGGLGGIFAAVNGYRTMKRTSPIAEIKKEIKDNWDKFYNDKWDGVKERLEKVEDIVRHVDSERTKLAFEDINAKLDNDNRRIKAIIETSHIQQKFLVLLLKAQQQSLAHLSDGNHRSGLKQVSDEIQEFLLYEATRVAHE